jgi:hypothetical protein
MADQSLTTWLTNTEIGAIIGMSLVICIYGIIYLVNLDWSEVYYFFRPGKRPKPAPRFDLLHMLTVGGVLAYHMQQSNFLNKNNMAQVTIRGYLTQVGPVLEVGEKKTKKQENVVMIPARTNEFNEVYPGSRPQQWEIISLGETLNKVAVTPDMQGKKVEVGVYIESYLVTPDGKEPFFSKEFKLASIKILD